MTGIVGATVVVGAGVLLDEYVWLPLKFPP
jgi:hypothetical protein